MLGRRDGRLITSALRQIDDAIYSLGSGAYQAPIRIQSFPKDLQTLGERLDWLRTRLSQLDQQQLPNWPLTDLMLLAQI